MAEAPRPPPSPSHRALSRMQEIGFDIENEQFNEEQLKKLALMREMSLEEEEASDQKIKAIEEEHLLSLKKALAAKVKAKSEQVFSHDFLSPRLGFSVALSKYGDEGRKLVEINSTRADCELYPDILKPRDELIAINDELVVCRDANDFNSLLLQLKHSKRPLHLTFMQGQNRDDAFFIQEEEQAFHTISRTQSNVSEDAYDSAAVIQLIPEHSNQTASSSPARIFDHDDLGCGSTNSCFYCS